MIGHAVTLQHRRHRPHWLAKRRRGITATDVPAILGLSPWATPVDVWLHKTGRAKPTEVTYPMERGNALEALVLRHYAEQTKAELLPVPVLAGHPDDPLAMASLDGAAIRDGQTRIVEIKTTGWRGREDWWGDEKGLPDHYVAQIAWQQYVCGIDVADAAADVAGEFVIVEDIERSREFEAYAVPLLHDWWQRYVVTDVAPPADAQRDWQALSLLWKPRPGVTVIADDQTVWDVAEYQRARDAEKKAKADKQEAGLKLREFMAGADLLTDADGNRLASISKTGSLTVARTPGGEKK